MPDRGRSSLSSPWSLEKFAWRVLTCRCFFSSNRVLLTETAASSPSLLAQVLGTDWSHAACCFAGTSKATKGFVPVLGRASVPEDGAKWCQSLAAGCGESRTVVLWENGRVHGRSKDDAGKEHKHEL